jgi:hypothetical protein
MSDCGIGVPLFGKSHAIEDERYTLNSLQNASTEAPRADPRKRTRPRAFLLASKTAALELLNRAIG